MPTFFSPEYKPSFFFKNGHWSTIYPALIRKAPDIKYNRNRIQTPDDDFLDLDFSEVGANQVVILCHGLEGDSKRPYMRAMCKHLNNLGFDVIAFNFRGCSGVPNKQLRMYHSGATDDLQVVVDYAKSLGYESISLLGFSLGANLILKYLGEQEQEIDFISNAVAIAPPCDLNAASNQIMRFQNYPYFIRFLKSLKQKVKTKAKQYSEVDLERLNKIRSISEFDDLYTAPLHGFKDANDYYTKCRSKIFIPHITTRTLIISAENDPLLPKECIPYLEAKENPNVNLLVSKFGGHTGFPLKNKIYWHEMIAGKFLKKKIFSDIYEN